MRVFFSIWVIFTLALFYLGPVPWPGREDPRVALIVLASLLAFHAGAVGGARLPALPQAPRILTGSWAGRMSVVGLWVLLSALHVYGSTGLVIFDPSAYSLDFGDVYEAYVDSAGARVGNEWGALFTLVIFAKAMIFVPVLFLLASDFRERPLLAAAILFPFFGSSMMRGTDKEFADILILVVILFHYHRMMSRRFLIVIAMIAVVLVFFAARKIARFDDVLPRCLPHSIVCFDFESNLATLVSPSAEILMVFLSNYLTQGYNAMSLALELPFEFNWGIGHLPPLKDNICEALRIGCAMGDFQERLYEVGWDTRYRWTSAYTVIANDTHWVFVPAYFFLMGGVFGVSERSWRENRDGFSLGALLIVSLFVAYSSINMQIAISMDWTLLTLAVLGGQTLRIVRHATVPDAARRAA